MSPVAAFAIVLAIAAVAGAVFVLNGHLAGIGRSQNALRAPHGPLVRTRLLDNPDEGTFGRRVERMALPVALITGGLLLLCVAGLISLGGSVAVSLDILLVVAVLVLLSQGSVGPWRGLGCAIAGYLVVGGGACLLLWWQRESLGFVDAAVANGATMVFGTLGACLSLASLRPCVRVARQFEDGTVNVVKVVQGAFACRLLLRFEDGRWTPDKEALRRAEALDDIRSEMGKRDRHE